MDNYKLAIIHGKEYVDRDIKIGDIEYVGDKESDFHAECLLNYANKYHNDIEVFKKLSVRHSPEVIGFMFLNYFDDVIFFNTTKNVEKHGYSGVFLIPDNISMVQKEKLFEFAMGIDKYKVHIFHSLRLEDGMLNGDEIYSFENQSPVEMLKNFFDGNGKKRG